MQKKQNDISRFLTDLKHPNKFENLKLGTAITSSWFLMALNLNFINMGGTMTQRLAMTAFLAGTMLTPFLKEIIKLPAKLVTRLLIARSPQDAPDELKGFNAEISKSMGFKSPLKLHFFTKGRSKNAFCLYDEIYVGEKLYNSLESKERKFIVAHEAAHAKTKDAPLIYLTVAPYFTSMVTPILTIATAFRIAVPYNSPLLSTVSVGTAIASSALCFQFTKASRRYVSRICEYRADRNAVTATKDSFSAMGALAKISHGVENVPWFKSINRTHPEIQKRIQNIVDSFNQNNPENFIGTSFISFEKARIMKDPVFIDAIGMAILEADYKAMVIDATKYDGNTYLAGLHPKFWDKIEEIPAGQPLPDPL